MPKYVDGFVISLPRVKVAEYKKLAQLGARVWMEHGALEYRECVGEEMDNPFCLPMTRLARSKPGETVIFAWIVYRSKKHRDIVNRKVMADPRMREPPEDMPFDPRRMAYGGFEVLVEKTK